VPTERDGLTVLQRALAQTAQLLDEVRADVLSAPTPCEEWTVAQLVDHIVAAPARFASMVRGEPIDWSAPTPAAGEHPGRVFRTHAEQLVQAWREADPRAEVSPVDWQCAELAVHTWDLATAIGRPTQDLDREVAELGLAFMRAALADEDRGSAFAPQQDAPEGADPYQRIAAFAGRTV
jgi:uncharacterized protein (TIGR03086 family)